MRPLTVREKQALVLWLVSATIIAIIYYWPAGGLTPQTANLPQKEKLVLKLRRQAASEGGRQEVMKKVGDELTRREKGMLSGETAPQAQAQLLQIVRRVGAQQQPSVQFKSFEFGPTRPLGSAYGEVSTIISLDGGIEQVVNFLSDLGNQPELISVTDLQFGPASGRQKLVPLRATITGIVPRRLVPAKKEGAAF